MSIEKLTNASKVHIEPYPYPYTKILNSVIHSIKDNDAFRVWVFCASKPEDWTVIKDWTRNQCGVGEKKAKKIWSYLHRCGLCSTIVVKNKQGKIIRFDLKILNGIQFNTEESFIKTSGAKRTPVVKNLEKKPVGHKTTPVENHTGGFGRTTKKENTKLLKSTKKRKSFCSKKQKNKAVDNSKKHSFANSMDQNAREKTQIEEHEKRKQIEMGARSATGKTQIKKIKEFLENEKHD